MKGIQTVLWNDTLVGKFMISGKSQRVYRRESHDGQFIRFVCYRGKREIAAMRKSYGKAGKQMGITSWFQPTDDELKAIGLR